VPTAPGARAETEARGRKTGPEAKGPKPLLDEVYLPTFGNDRHC
jgi:hypothetical protein